MKRNRNNLKSVILVMCLCLFICLFSPKGILAQSEEKFQVRYADPSPLAPGRTQTAEWMCKEIERLSNGRINFQFYWGGSLLDNKEMPTGIRTGSVEFGPLAIPFYPSLYPLGTITMAIPFTGLNTRQTSYAYMEIMENSSLIDEFKTQNQKVISVNSGLSYGIYSKKPIRSLTDLKGLKIRVPSAERAEIVAIMGAVPVRMSFPETYEALQRGVLGGTLGDVSHGIRFKFYELTKYFTPEIFPPQSSVTVVNLKFFNSLPHDLQEIIIKIGKKTISYAADQMEKGENQWIAQLKENGVQFVDFSEDEMTSLKYSSKIKSLPQKWIKEKSSRGAPAQDVMTKWIEIIDRMKQ